MAYPRIGGPSRAVWSRPNSPSHSRLSSLIVKGLTCVSVVVNSHATLENQTALTTTDSVLADDASFRCLYDNNSNAGRKKDNHTRHSLPVTLATELDGDALQKDTPDASRRGRTDTLIDMEPFIDRENVGEVLSMWPSCFNLRRIAGEESQLLQQHTNSVGEVKQNYQTIVPS